MLLQPDEYEGISGVVQAVSPSNMCQAKEIMGEFRGTDIRVIVSRARKSNVRSGIKLLPSVWRLDGG